ncbi:hypothetical protein GLOTRDRAFT_77982 [Gloeophyllum trabeum ATCC 11539]|uniref:Uncharacterized protein n=1 Tax=Gloeophyllum trabeum (strain ATCC 11539 / FP-39264 / Madison 617) TaxID=670483 RepID=S7RID9_GLOTA|nr:uncharacterized protein GLOTRDRAFT_77982 [Gloeophyllum trabeum ATCC 11539]EPQ54075.1 hypothetical protein GLOTRDRAFT_77982 [Gloeophyllum trabeum ATCC 11539]
MSPRPRRRSVDSSSSSSSSDSDSGYKPKKDKHHRAGHAAFPTPVHHPSGHIPSPGFPLPGVSRGNQHAQNPMASESDRPQFPVGGEHRASEHPPPYSAPAPPPSGYRLPLTTTSAFPPLEQAGRPPCFDADGQSPVFLGSALFPNSVHPCKIVPSLNPPCRVPYGGGEHEHNGRYDLLPFTPETMEWVPTSHGRIPDGRRPVEGGYEEHGAKLYHALAQVSGIHVPGKTGEHLGGCNVAFGGAEHTIRENYAILCWK